VTDVDNVTPIGNGMIQVGTTQVSIIFKMGDMKNLLWPFGRNTNVLKLK